MDTALQGLSEEMMDVTGINLKDFAFESGRGHTQYKHDAGHDVKRLMNPEARAIWDLYHEKGRKEGARRRRNTFMALGALITLQVVILIVTAVTVL